MTSPSKYYLAPVFCIGAFVLAGVSTAASKSASASTTARYAALDAVPDIAGIWTMDRKSMGTTTVAALKPPLKPELQNKVFKNAQNEPSLLCKTRTGMPVVMGSPLPLEILINPGQITLIFESDGKARRIFTDGRKRSDIYYPQSMGYSEGRWEGNTLVVTTTDVDETIPITPMGGVNHGPHMRIDERFTWIAPGVMHVKTVTTDPDTLTEPWVVERTYRRDPAGFIFEYSCEQNNRESVDENGVQHVDLTPPP